MQKDNRWCLICQPKNRTLYWHKNKDGTIWAYCNKCDRGYSFKQYCSLAGIDDPEAFLSGRFYVEEAADSQVNALPWPAHFIPLSDPRAQAGVDYIKSRGLTTNGDMYYDMEENGIVFPYYFENQFCGAQVRFIEPRTREDGSEWKITTLSGTRLGLLFYGWNQTRFMGNVKGVVVVEGAFNAISINQALNVVYGGIANNPWRAIACSGSGATEHQKQAIKELREQGIKTIIAPDTDDAGKKMWLKFVNYGAASHFAFTRIIDTDWNDCLKTMGHKEFAKFFLSQIEQINDGHQEEAAGSDSSESLQEEKTPGEQTSQESA